MKFRSMIIGLLATAIASSAQVASHAPTKSTTPAKVFAESSEMAAMAAKPVVRVNGAVLTEIDLKREIYMMFPYAQQHGGVPKSMEAEIRKGAMDMIIFEELLYQEAKRRHFQVAPQRLAKAEADFRKQFPTNAAYQEYLKIEFKGSPQVLRDKIS